MGAYWFVYNYPDTAGFLTSKERAVIQTRLAADSDSTHNENFTWANVVRAFKDPKCWLYGFAFHTTSLPLYTYSLFLVSGPRYPAEARMETRATTNNNSLPSSKVSDTLRPMHSY